MVSRHFGRCQKSFTLIPIPIQSQWLLLSAASDAALMAEHKLWPWTPKFLSTVVVDVITKPLKSQSHSVV